MLPIKSRPFPKARIAPRGSFIPNCRMQVSNCLVEKDQRAIGLWSNRVIRKGRHGFSLEVPLSVSRNLTRRIGERMFLETITAGPSAKSHFLNVSFIYWEAFTHRQAKFVVNTTKTVLLQHWTNKNERATLSTLMAFPFS